MIYIKKIFFYVLYKRHHVNRVYPMAQKQNNSFFDVIYFLLLAFVNFLRGKQHIQDQVGGKQQIQDQGSSSSATLSNSTKEAILAEQKIPLVNLGQQKSALEHQGSLLTYQSRIAEEIAKKEKEQQEEYETQLFVAKLSGIPLVGSELIDKKIVLPSPSEYERRVDKDGVNGVDFLIPVDGDNNCGFTSFFWGLQDLMQKNTLRTEQLKTNDFFVNSFFPKLTAFTDGAFKDIDEMIDYFKKIDPHNPDHRLIVRIGISPVLRDCAVDLMSKQLNSTTVLEHLQTCDPAIAGDLYGERSPFVTLVKSVIDQYPDDIEARQKEIRDQIINPEKFQRLVEQQLTSLRTRDNFANVDLFSCLAASLNIGLSVKNNNREDHYLLSDRKVRLRYAGHHFEGLRSECPIQKEQFHAAIMSKPFAQEIITQLKPANKISDDSQRLTFGGGRVAGGGGASSLLQVNDEYRKNLLALNSYIETATAYREAAPDMKSTLYDILVQSRNDLLKPEVIKIQENLLLNRDSSFTTIKSLLDHFDALNDVPERKSRQP